MVFIDTRFFLQRDIGNTAVCSTCMLLQYTKILGNEYTFIILFLQVLLYTLLALFLFNPTKTLRYEARFWALRVLGRIFCAPFFYVGFADFWLADQLNSLHTVFLDFQYFLCFYIQNTSWYNVTG